MAGPRLPLLTSHEESDEIPEDLPPELRLDPISRRRMLELSLASMALASASCTRQPLEHIVPYVKQPEGVIPGKPLYFATTIPLGGYGRGLIAESHLGRPTKLEGNPLHPGSLGATDAITQAAILNLYDPDRSQVIAKFGNIQTWEHLTEELAGVTKSQVALRGSGFRILTETITSVTLADQIQDLFIRFFPEAKWHQWDPAGRDAVRAGAKLAFGKYVDTRYDFTQADVVVSLDADFFFEGPGAVRYLHDWSSRRKAREHETNLSRLYVVETARTLAGACADHRLAVNPATLSAIALALAAEVGVAGAARPKLDAKIQKFVTAVAADLRKKQGRSIVVAGEYAPAEIHALCHAVNASLKNVGTTVAYSEPVEAKPVDQLASLADLTKDLLDGKVDVLVILGSNPVFTAPRDLDFVDALQKAKLSIHLGPYADETAEYCHWHVPETHFLEAWGDARAYDGTISIIQPLVEPLYAEAKSATQLLAALMEQPNVSSHDVVKGYWHEHRATVDFDSFWRHTLHDGVFEGSSVPTSPATLDQAGVKKAVDVLAAEKPAGGLVVVFRPDPTISDGRFANNGWLQETPKPLTKLTWDNALCVSPNRAKELGLTKEEIATGGVLVTVTCNGKSVEAPVWCLPGLADDVAVLNFGYGRRRTGRVGRGAGFDVYPLRTSDKLWRAPATVARTDRSMDLFTTQTTGSMEGRPLARSGTLATFTKDPEFAAKMGEAAKKSDRLYPGFEYKEYAWGLSIDLSSCVGCNACVVACQSENNSPVVGKDQIGRGRSMQWLRVDRYWDGDEEHPTETHLQPVMCQHCEQAPCEVVCPVGATVHSSEGLNDMVYNRCVGTKYCSNNCPYKVRHFNFFGYSDTDTPVLKLMRNPNVTVRTRGVMEKCTYCVQRINAARIRAEEQNRPIADGDILTACQQACPAGAIVFGNINDPGAKVTHLKKQPHDYPLLGDLNTQPRTTYLARIRNPNPDLEDV
jgi:molybdopterin-containing oxidoreductase family iron-sulfur binding subunit